MVVSRGLLWLLGLLLWLLVLMALVSIADQSGPEVFPREDGSVALRERLILRRSITPLRHYFPDPDARRFTRAIVWGRIDRVRQMIDQGADVDIEGQYGITPLYVALLSLNYEIFELLVEVGADVYHEASEFATYDLFDMGARFSDSRYIVSLIRRSRQLGNRDRLFYREIVFDALTKNAPVSTMAMVLESIPPMSLIGSPYGHPAINAVTLRKYHKAILLVDYDPSLFDDDELRSQFLRRLEETQQFDDEFFRARAELVEHLENEHRIEVQLQYPEPREH